MNTRRHNIINIVATGVLASFLLCIGLFWARWLCRIMRADLLPHSAHEVTIYPAKAMRAGESADANRLAVPRVRASMPSSDPLLTGLGTLQYLLTHVPGVLTGQISRHHVYRQSLELESDQVYFDSSLGLIVRKGVERVHRDDGTRTSRHFTYYVGPEGIAKTAEESLGRFISPLADPFQVEPQAVYDRGLRRFFGIHWSGNDRGVKKGPELADDGKYQPVQIGWLRKNFVSTDVFSSEPFSLRPASSSSAVWEVQYLDQVLVLDASGRIDLLDPETLELQEGVAHLPMPITLLPSERSVARPEDVSAYNVVPLHCRDSNARGIAVATLSREGLSLDLEYFDTKGAEIANSWTSIPRYKEFPGSISGHVDDCASEREAYYGLPGAGILTVAQFVLESLHPPILVLASYLAGPHFEATAGYRSVFLLPDSFVAKISRSGGGSVAWERFLVAQAYMVPGLFLFALLAVKLDREGIRGGVPKNVRRAWALGTLVLGLPVYVTYRLTRPKATLVTCANCGLGRRPDRDKCHRCGSVWTVPELTPPAWRVLDEPEQADVASPSPAQEMGSPATDV